MDDHLDRLAGRFADLNEQVAREQSTSRIAEAVDELVLDGELGYDRQTGEYTNQYGNSALTVFDDAARRVFDELEPAGQARVMIKDQPLLSTSVTKGRLFSPSSPAALSRGSLVFCT